MHGRIDEHIFMEIKNLKILVTGGAGFIGSNLVDKLAKDNDVVILDDFWSGESSWHLRVMPS